MELSIDESILKAYGLKSTYIKIQQIGPGMINGTYLLTSLSRHHQFVLQRINTKVFTDPKVIAQNIETVANFLQTNFPEYLFPAPLATKIAANQYVFLHKNEYWRLMLFIDGAVALSTLSAPNQAYEAAKQFGKLSRMLDHLDSGKLSPTIVGFHHLDLRFKQFQTALKQQ